MFKRQRLPIIIATIPFILSLGLLTRSQLANNSSRKSQQLEVINKTQSLEVTARLGPDKKLHNELMVTVKFTNISNRACTGYFISFPGRSGGTGADLDRPDDRLQPGQSTTQSVPPCEVMMEDGQLRPVVVEMALFDDDSIEGNEKWGMDMLGTRLGEAIQFARSRALFEKLLDVPDENMPAALDKLTSEIAALPTDDDQSYSGWMAANPMYRFGVRMGLGTGRSLLLQEIDWLKRPSHGPLKPNAPFTEAEVRAMDSAEKRSAIVSIVEKSKKVAKRVARVRQGYSWERSK